MFITIEIETELFVETTSFGDHISLSNFNQLSPQPDLSDAHRKFYIAENKQLERHDNKSMQPNGQPSVEGGFLTFLGLNTLHDPLVMSLELYSCHDVTKEVIVLIFMITVSFSKKLYSMSL